MKKFFVGILAIAGLVACAQDEVLRQQASEEIAFGGAFVNNNVSRAEDPSTTTTSLEEFSVWGYMDSSKGTVLVDERVYENGVWKYDNIQYWTKGHDYRFFAFAPYHSNNTTITLSADPYVEGLGKVEFENVAGTEDLLYASATAETKTQTYPGKVNLTFAHLLTKVKFSFKNTFVNEFNTVVVNNIKMEVPKLGTIVLNENDNYVWTDLAETTTLSFSQENEAETRIAANGGKGESYYERLTIPAGATQEYKVTFHVKLYMGDELAYEGDKTTYIKGCELLPGHSYNFTATLNHENVAEDELRPIEFTAEVNEWVEAGEVAAYQYEADGFGLDTTTGIYHITNKAGLAYFAEQVNGGRTFAGETVVLDGDIDLSATRAASNWTPIGNVETTAYESKKFAGIFDGNGYSIKNMVVTEQKTAGFFGSMYSGTIKNLTIENATVNSNHYAAGLIAWVEQGGKPVVIENCHVKNSTITTAPELVNGVYDNGDKAGGLVGHAYAGAYKNCSVENVAVKGYRDLGGIAGYATKATVSNCLVKNVTITQDLTNGYKSEVPTTLGAVVGRVGENVALANNTEENVAITTEVSAPEALASLLTSDKENIAVCLQNDIEVAMGSLGQQTGGSGEYKLGGENTKTITIDLNGKKLNITTTYMSSIGAKNNDALFTIKNGTMTSTGNKATTWNIYDLTFANCNYVIEDVVFEKSVALAGVNKNVTLKNVTINEAQNLYALWVRATGLNVTIDGLTINAGRGIKIDEQYVDAPAKVTLSVANATFTTTSKAAIMVKSAAGAEVNLSNVNIEAVAEDQQFAVWVDEDAAAHADKVVVNGGLKRVEGAPLASAGSQSEFTNAIADGATIMLSAGNYNMPSTGGNNITIIGDKDVVINAGASNMGNGNVTLEGVTITAGSYKGFQHSGVVTYNNVTINGQLNCYGTKDIFNNCTFELDNAYVWTYGSDYTEFNNCVFNTTGKAILIYNEGAGACNVKVDGCTFNATAGAKAGAIANQNCAAIELDNYAGMKHVLTTNNNTYSENFSGEWRIKSYVAGAPVSVNGVEYTSLAIDGKTMTIDANKNVTVE